MPPEQPATGFHAWLEPGTDPPRIGVAGEIDLSTCAAFRFILDDALAMGSGTIAVDFSRVDFIGSNGIRELKRFLRDVDRLELHAPKPSVRRILELSGFDGHLVIVD